MGPLWVWMVAAVLAMLAGIFGVIGGNTMIGVLFLAMGVGVSGSRRRT